MVSKTRQGPVAFLKARSPVHEWWKTAQGREFHFVLIHKFRAIPGTDVPCAPVQLYAIATIVIAVIQFVVVQAAV